MTARLLREGAWPDLAYFFGVRPPDVREGRYSHAELNQFLDALHELRSKKR